MSSSGLEDKVGNEQRGTQIREHFLGWKCRIREYIMRQGKGRPTPGICPRVILEDGSESSSFLTLLLLPREPRESILQFSHMVLRIHDPQDLYNKGGTTAFLNILPGSRRFQRNYDGSVFKPFQPCSQPLIQMQGLGDLSDWVLVERPGNAH